MTRLDQVGELGVIEALRPFLATSGYLIPALADDAAAWEEPAGVLVASCDQSVEGVHFDLGWMSPEDAGWRALALALGDLAAKGATPTYALAAMAAPPGWELERLLGLYRGLADLAGQVGLRLAGGDTSSTPGPAVLTLAVLGRVPRPPLARSQAKPGWAVGVTGPLGAAALALKRRQAVRLPPRLEEGRRLNQAGLCCGDISDGLYRELEKFAASSGAGCDLRLDRVPCVPGASPELAAASGEEAELVCAGPEEVLRAAGLEALGRLTRGGRLRVFDGGRQIELKERGYDHFA